MYAPYIPHITEELYQRIYRKELGVKSLHCTCWPQKVEIPEGGSFAEKAGNAMVAVLGSIRRFKAERNLSVKAPVEKVILKGHPEKHELLSAALDDLRAVGNIRQIVLEPHDKRDEGVVILPDTGFPESAFPME